MAAQLTAVAPGAFTPEPLLSLRFRWNPQPQFRLPDTDGSSAGDHLDRRICLQEQLQSPLGQIICAASRDGFQHRDQFRSLDLCDGACADMREDIGFKAPHDLAGMLFAARGLPVIPPFPCHRLKRVFGGRPACQLVGLSDDHGVVAGGQQFAGLVLTFTRLRQRQSGVSAQRQDLLLTEYAVFPAPQFRAGRAD
jgi:hypothetical protein